MYKYIYYIDRDRYHDSHYVVVYRVLTLRLCTIDDNNHTRKMKSLIRFNNIVQLFFQHTVIGGEVIG